MKITPEMHTEMIEFYNQTTNEQKLYFLQLMGKDINLVIDADEESEIDYCASFYEITEPHTDINLNGKLFTIYLKL